MKKNLYYILYIGVLMMFLAGCQDEGIFTAEEDEQVSLTYRIKLDDEMYSRAIGDGSQIDELVVGVFETINNQKKQVMRKVIPVSGLSAIVTLELFKTRTYDLVFWAQKANNGVYNTDDLSQIKINYDSFSKTQAEGFGLDAFYEVRTGVKVSEPGSPSVTLTRPFAQLGFGVYGSDVEKEKISSVKITVNSTLYTGFKPLETGEKVVEGDAQSYTFTFTDFGDKSQTFSIHGKDYTYLTANYFLVPTTSTETKIGGSVRFLDVNGSPISTFDFTDAPLLLNTRVNIGKGLTEVWDGVEIEALPEPENGIIHIENTKQLAYLIQNGLEGDSEESKKVLLTKDLNMNYLPVNRSDEYVLENIEFDGGGHTLYNLGSSLFNVASNISVTNLNVVGTEDENVTHVGTLVNTLVGSGRFTGVTISDSRITAENGAAGGLVGYIVRSDEDNPDESLEVIFDDCHVQHTTTDGSITEGYFVGLFSGYDEGEVLIFKDNCSLTTSANRAAEDVSSYYVNANKATWLKDTDFSPYDGWLGKEKYYRGIVRFGYVDENNKGIQFIPKWDGTTKVEPLKDGNTILIYSAFDLATLQGATPTAVTFKKNVDLGSHKFKPIYSVQTLEGENNTVYNLTVLMEKHDGMGAAFIQSAPTGKVNVSHKNLILIGADVKNYHDTSLYPAFGVTNDGGAGNAYGGIFISKANSCESYTIDNIHVKDSKLYAVCKMGGIIGQSVGTKLYMSNCSVDNCIIQNYQPNVPNYYVLGDDSQPWMVKSSLYINLLQWWYTNGEAGGLIGFLQNSDSDIDNCSVTNTQINCSGQDNKTVVANVYSEKQFDKNNLWKANKSITAKGETTIAGRHVNQFIGDVVSYSSTEGGTNYTVDITNYTVSGNSYNGTLAESTDKYNHQYDKSGDKYGTNANLYCEVVGCAYYIGLDIIVIGQNLGHLKYYAGNVAFSSKDGQTNGSFTEASGEGDNINIAWTGGNFKITGALLWVKSEYPTEPARKDPIY